jgi:hypothetical protein
MRRFVALSAVLALAGCQADDRPTGPPGPRPLAAISDGAHGGTRGFFFLPPLVPTPTFTGTFNASLAPSVEICELTASLEPACVGGPPVTRFEPSAITVDATTGQYHVNWKSDDSPLDVAKNYRIRVFIGSSGEGMELGFRDVHPVATPQEVPKDPESGDLYVFTFGSNIPIKFRIEKGALCAPGATDCGEGTLDAGGGLVLANFAGVETSVSTLPGQVTLIVERITCPRTADGRVDFLPMDIPQFAGCYRVRSIPVLTGPMDPPATVGVCLDPNPTNLTTRQEELLELHRFDRSRPELGVEALPVVPFPIECQDFASATANPLMNLARAGLRALQQALSPWVSPPPLLAVPPGLGGLTGSFSDFVWALPSKMAILVGDNQIAPLSTAVAIPPAVIVTDRDDMPVQGASVSFAVTLGGGTVIPAAPLQIVTGSDGIARVSSWTLGGTPGLNLLEASGIGLEATPRYSGYLERGVVTFHAIACAPGYGTATVDGQFGADEWRCANTYDFTAKVSGGSGTPATLYVMNDDARLYLAVRLRRSSADKVNTLQFNFDNNNSAASGTGAAETGDEVLSLDAARGFTDAFLTLRCTNSSQSSCWAADAGSGGTNDGSGAFRNDGTWTTYEISHPLNTADNAHDFSLAALSRVGLFLTLQTGSGATGNTQWPGFRRYQEIAIIGTSIP